jgi:hypothetical protein
MNLRRSLGGMARSVPFGLVIRGLVATGASNLPIDRLGIARFGAL